MFGLCYLTDTNCLDFIRLYRKGNLAVFDFNRLAVGLFQTVAAFCRMEGKVPVQGDICQAVLALIHTHNGTIAILYKRFILLALADPPRPEVPAAVAECRAAGASLLFVSHDQSLAPLFDRSLSLAELNRATKPAEV